MCTSEFSVRMLPNSVFLVEGFQPLARWKFLNTLANATDSEVLLQCLVSAEQRKIAENFSGRYVL